MATSGCSAGNSARFALLFHLPLGPHGIELDVVVGVWQRFGSRFATYLIFDDLSSCGFGPIQNPRIGS